ncbi:NUDIX hydrolase [Winogradskyella ursingii]|uniref:NUDIX hydrolase n=1 Tax=Winogradskyella ursingii TaxID=2686079 RepID=UPI0015C80CE0|nr:CoA pyrophosphatase [Winogradskyella ursingii]
MNFNTFLESVVKIKHLKLFGEASHAKMSPPYRLELAQKMKEKSKGAKKAAVMALFYPNKRGRTSLVLILRNTYKGVHSAQVGFPGGKYEDDDENLMVTAIRETEEEIGISKQLYDVLIPMTPLYIPPSNFLVHPFIGVSEEYLKFKKQDAEVKAIIEVELSDFLNETNNITTRVNTSMNVKVDVPAFQLNNFIVWGATAMMLSELKDLLNEVM